MKTQELLLTFADLFGSWVRHQEQGILLVKYFLLCVSTGEIKAKDTGHVSLIIQFQYKLHTIFAATRKQMLLGRPLFYPISIEFLGTCHFSESKSVWKSGNGSQCLHFFREAWISRTLRIGNIFLGWHGKKKKNVQRDTWRAKCVHFLSVSSTSHFHKKSQI